MANTNAIATALSAEAEVVTVRRALPWWVLLWRDKVALVAAVWLLLMVLCLVFGPPLFSEAALKVSLAARNAAPGFDHGLVNLLGTDALGRPLLPRLIVGARNTLMVATSVVAIALCVGGVLGLVAGYMGGIVNTIIMRLADVISSFPSLLLALIVLYVLEPSPVNLVLVLAITRTAIYLRVTRAEVLEIRERVFVEAARALGGSRAHIMARHVAPLVIPTLTTILTVDFASVMLSESALSFLGIGIQPPEVTWGLMVSQGRNYLTSAWWLAFFPGLAIMLTALAANLLSGWIRLISDPKQRWRLEAPRQVSKLPGDGVEGSK